MRFLLHMIVAAGLVYAGLHYMGHWWYTLVAVAVAALLLGKKGSDSFLAGLLGAGLTWFFLAFMIYQGEGGLVAQRISDLYSLSDELLLVVNGLVGAVLGGFGSLPGLHFRRLFSGRFQREEESVYARPSSRSGRRRYR